MHIPNTHIHEIVVTSPWLQKNGDDHDYCCLGVCIIFVPLHTHDLKIAVIYDYCDLHANDRKSGNHIYGSTFN